MVFQEKGHSVGMGGDWFGLKLYQSRRGYLVFSIYYINGRVEIVM